MTKEEMQRIKAVAVKIHARTVAAGVWETAPEWETCLMWLVKAMSGAMAANRYWVNASLKDFDYYDGKENIITFEHNYENYIEGSLEEKLAEAMIILLDTLEGFYPDWDTMFEDFEKPSALPYCPKCYYETFAGFCLTVVRSVVCLQGKYPYMLSAAPLRYLMDYTETHGIDLMRYVDLNMRFTAAMKRSGVEYHGKENVNPGSRKD